jgi:hypothetical protein
MHISSFSFPPFFLYDGKCWTFPFHIRFTKQKQRQKKINYSIFICTFMTTAQ